MNIKDFNESCEGNGMATGMLCSFCQKNAATSMWTLKGGDALFCCPECAVSVLPAITADSLQMPTNRMHLNWYVERAVSSFWKALAIRFVK